MKKRRCFIGAVALLSLFSSCAGNKISSSETSLSPSFDRELKIFFDPTKASEDAISPLIYGTFIEHIEKCIYGGIWAELIMDRKFVAPIGEDVSQWKKASGSTVQSEGEITYSGDYSAHMTAGSSFYQRGLQLEDHCGYDAYFYAQGSGSVEMSLIDSSGSRVSSEIVVASDSFAQYRFHLNSLGKGYYTVEYRLLNGEVYLDSLSLMKDDHIDGMRKDTLDKLKELNSPLYRWPGGNFVSGYDFYDGIGDRDSRPSRRNLEYAGALDDFKNDDDRLASDLSRIGSDGFYSVYEPNDFGVDEFIRFCQYVGAEPNIVLNSGLGSVQMALDEVEYLLGTDSPYASLRPQKEPYEVKYISIGNEMNGAWQLGHMEIGAYAEKHNAIAEGIKKISDSVEIIGVGDNSSSWSSEMIRLCPGNIDALSEHFYAERKEDSVKEHILSLKNQAAYRIANHREVKGTSSIKMAIDEFAYDNATGASRLKDGMGVAACYNEMIKNADVVELACYSSTVNATQGQILTDAYRAYMEGGGYVSKLYRSYMQDFYVEVICNLTAFDDYVEVNATVSSDRKTMSISVINASDEAIRIANGQIDEYLYRSFVTSDSFEGKNGEDSEELIWVEQDDSSDSSVVPPRSVSILTVRLK